MNDKCRIHPGFSLGPPLILFVFLICLSAMADQRTNYRDGMVFTYDSRFHDGKPRQPRANNA
jgi:hypothetical protein